MNLKGEIIAYHGWGFDSNCWTNWQKKLSDMFEFKAYDRGYFGYNNSPKFDDNTHKIKIIFSHSFGLHFCPLQQLKQANLLILFNSFAEFHPENEKQRKRSKYALKLMIDEFKENPKNVLETFYKKCYHPFPYIPLNYNNFNWDKLYQDLQLLDTSQLDINLLKDIPKIYIIHSSKDRIVSPFHAQNFAKKLSKNSEYYEIEGVGHSLPFTDINSCLPIINQALGDIENHGTN
jgi:pimeloyl-[acyl-carrier protein] methyl ester esterase